MVYIVVGFLFQKRQAQGAVDWNDPVALSEAITKMFNGELTFPQYDPANLPKSSFDCGNQQNDGYYADPELECQVMMKTSLPFFLLFTTVTKPQAKLLPSDI
jgi:hypothetical protein